MAARYWVGGTGTWDAVNTANWSATSGGLGGATVPTSSDNIIFNASSGGGIVTLGINGICTIIDFTGFTGTIDFVNTYKISCVSSGTTIITAGTTTTFSNTPRFDLTYSGGVGTRTINCSIEEANALSFYITAGTDTIAAISRAKTVDFTGFAGTWAGNSVLFGNLVISTGMTLTASTNLLIFRATSGTQQITTNGKLFDFPIFKQNAGTLQFQDNLTMGSTRTFTLTAGALDLSSGNRTLSTGLFSSSNSFVRSIAFGTGNITVTGNAGSVINMTTMTEFSYSGTPTFNSTYAGSVGTRNFLLGNGVGATASNVIDVNITAGTDILGVATYVGNLNLTGFAGTLSNSVRYVYGNFNVPSGATLTAGTGTTVFAATSGIKLITTNNQTLDFPIFIGDVGNTSANATFRLIGNLTIGSTRNTLLASGTLDLNENTLSTGTVSSTQNNTRVIVFGSLGQITTTGTGTVWNVTATLGFSHTGTSKINVSNNSATAVLIVTTTTTEAQSLNFNFINGTYTLTSTAQFRSVDYTGFSGTLNNNVRTIYGSATFSTGMTLTAGTNTTTFASTSAGNIITSAGQTQDYPITFNGVGGVWTCQDALTLGATCALTLTNGTLNLKSNAASTVGSFVTTGTNQKFLGSSTLGTQATISDASGVNSANYLTISDSFATGGADWEAFYANNNVDAGNNSNWDFGATPILGTEYTYTLRSFTQPRRF